MRQTDGKKGGRRRQTGGNAPTFCPDQGGISHPDSGGTLVEASSTVVSPPFDAFRRTRWDPPRRPRGGLEGSPATTPGSAPTQPRASRRRGTGSTRVLLRNTHSSACASSHCSSAAVSKHFRVRASRPLRAPCTAPREVSSFADGALEDTAGERERYLFRNETKKALRVRFEELGGRTFTFSFRLSLLVLQRSTHTRHDECKVS